MSDKTKDCCRICLDVETDRVPILDDPGIQLHMKSCLALAISGHDNLPQTVCMSCVSQLREFYHFQLSARCSQDWLESCIQEKSKKTNENKTPIQPLPDSEYNSDSLLEFLNNTANIEEYLSNLGKEDIPSIVNMLDKNHENSMDAVSKLTNHLKAAKVPSPIKREIPVKGKKSKIEMEIDVLDSDIEIVKEILMRETEPKPKVSPTKIAEKAQYNCFSCKTKFEAAHELSQHLTICETAMRTCVKCGILFDSKQQMIRHRLTHTATYPTTCNCGKLIETKELLAHHYRDCFSDCQAKCIFRCKQCSVIFYERFQLYKHAKEHVIKDEKRICDICGHSFFSNDTLAEHKKTVHGKLDNLSYRCKICSFTSTDKSQLYCHVQKHAITIAPQSHLCESCGQSFSTASSLTRHSQLHRNGNNTCLLCNKHFKTTELKNKHICEMETVICEHCGDSVIHGKLNYHSCN